MSISEANQSPPGGPAVEHQKIGMPPRQNFQQNSGQNHASATTFVTSPEAAHLSGQLRAIQADQAAAKAKLQAGIEALSSAALVSHDLGAMSSSGGSLLFGGDKSAQTTMVVSDPVTEAELAKARNELLWGSSPVMTNSESSSSSLASARMNCSAGAHEWDHKTHRCIHCQTPVTSFMLQASAWNAVPLSAPSHWVYPLSSYGDRLQKISQQQTTDAAVETEVSKLRREVASLQERVAQLNRANLHLANERDSLREQNTAQAALIASMSGDQFPDTDGLFKARVEASAVAAVDEPVNVEKAAQDTLDAMVARKLSRGMTEKLRDTAVESLRKGDRDASVGRAIGARFGGGLRQPW